MQSEKLKNAYSYLLIFLFVAISGIDTVHYYLKDQKVKSEITLVNEMEDDDNTEESSSKDENPKSDDDLYFQHTFSGESIDILSKPVFKAFYFKGCDPISQIFSPPELV